MSDEQNQNEAAARDGAGSELTRLLGGMPKPMWWADYECGCTSAGVATKRGLSAICRAHGCRMTTYHHGLPPNAGNERTPLAGGPLD